MRIIRLVFLLFSFTFISCQKGVSQTDNKKAKKLYQQGSSLIDTRKFEEGIEVLELAISQDPNYLDALLKLGAAYKTMNMHNVHLVDIKRVYSQVAKIDADSPSRVGIYYDLAEIFLNEGNYAIAKKYLDRVKKYPDANKRVTINANYLYDKVSFALVGIQSPIDFNPVKLPEETINRYAFNSHPILTADKKTMVISARNSFGNMDENVMVSEFVNGKWEASKSISQAINTPRNEGMASISGDGRILVFTSCYREDSRGGCDLYTSNKIGNEWTTPKNLGYKVNSTHKDSEASISADGRTIFFSSDRNPGFGYDLYKTTLNEKGEWTDAQNLGAEVNTKYNESTPFIHADGNHLYFASDGHLGYGGYDVFVSEIKNTLFSEPKNLGYPLNTSDNEGSLYVSPDYSVGYFEKYEKKAAESRSLIYSFDFPEKIKGEFMVKYIKGHVFDADTKQPIEATLELTSISTDSRNQFMNSDRVSGEYLVVLKEGEEYALHIEKTGYLFHSQNLDFANRQKFNPIDLDIYLQKIVKGKQLVLSNLFYDTDKYLLNAKSKTELTKLIYLLNSNPLVNIEIEGHTDNKGNAINNKTLSTNRAKSVYDYLIEKGISASRLKYQGYANLKPLASNDSEEGRKKNRRIEVRIL